jgi:WD40 repeat protein
MTSGQRICRFECPELVTRLTWHEDGDLLAVTCQDHHVYVWDTGTARLHARVRHANPQRAAYAHGGDLLLSWGWDDTSRLWNVWTAQELLRIPGAAGQLSRDGQRLATQSGRDLTLWELACGREYHTLPRRRISDKEALWEGDLSPDGRWLAQGTDLGLRVWDAARGRGGTLIKDPRVTDARFHPSGKWLYTSGPGGLFCWPLESGPGTLRIGPARKLPVTGYLERMGFGRDAGILAVADLRAGVLHPGPE